MAFRRDPTLNVLFMVSWKHQSEGDDATQIQQNSKALEKARTLSHELYDIIGNAAGEQGVTDVQKLGYSNYGEPEFFFH
jgi:hypothetical protein